MKLIYAAAANGAFGNRGKLPWPLIGADLRRFRYATLGHACIMGRKTFETLPSTLDDRQPIVITSQYRSLRKKGFLFVPNFDTARRMAPNAFVIGGLRVITEALPFIDDVYFTYVIGDYECDVEIATAQELFAPPLFDCWEETQDDLRCRFFRFRKVI
jgi:dihydrofolate reductase